MSKSIYSKNALRNPYMLDGFRRLVIATPCVYFLYDGDELVYVGKSNHGVFRVYQHLGSKRFTHYAIQNCDVEYMDELEQAYIKLYRPKYNLVVPRKTHPWSYAAMTHQNYHNIDPSKSVRPRDPTPNYSKDSLTCSCL